MTWIPQTVSIVSPDGANSDNVISGGNWSVDTYTGTAEENDYAYLGVNLQVDESGTLFFDFSQDGTNWSSYPVAGFAIASGINEVHTAWKGGRYFRARFVGTGGRSNEVHTAWKGGRYFRARFVGTGGRSFFRLKTFYSNHPLPLSAALNQSIGEDQDATVVRAVNTGQIPDGTYINNPSDGAGFRTTDNVLAGATYDSGVLDLTNYTQVGTSIIADKDGTLDFIFGSASNMTGLTPGANGVERVITIPYTASSGYQYFSAPAFTPYVRYRYTNDEGTDTTQMFFDTRFLTKSVSGQLLRMDGFINPSMVANLGKNVIVGQNKAGRFNNIPVDSQNNLKVNLKGPNTSFGQVATAEETTIISQQFPYNINARVVTTTTANGGTVTQADSQAVLSTSAAANGSAKMVTNSIMKYQPGTGSVVRFTAAFTTGVANNTQTVGYGDDNDGFFIGYNGASFGIMRRQDGSDTWTALTASNIDHLDGAADANNPSAITLDPTKGNVYQIKLQWLGYGAITFSVEDENTGEFEPFHVIKYANNFVVPSIYAPALPILWETTNTTNATDIVIKSASAMAALEGRRVFNGPTFLEQETGVTAVHVFSIRNDATNVLGGTNTNRHSIFIKGFSVVNDGTSTTTYSLEINSVITTPTWAKVSTNESIVSKDTAGTLGTAGDLVASFSVAKNTGVTENLFSERIELRPGDTLSVRASNTNSTDCSVSWVEDI
jgi:hypothetical protein